MCKTTMTVALILVIIGALNWGLYGVSGIDAVALILGSGSILAKIVYVAVGLAGLYSLVLFKVLGLCKCGCGCGIDCKCGCNSSDKGEKKESCQCNIEKK